jgi:alkylation response protein AidB-like acyl-CoA dehydrogenase
MAAPILFPIGCHHPEVDTLAAVLDAVTSRAERTRLHGPWESGVFAVLAEHGVLAGFLPIDSGGTAAHDVAITEFLLDLGGCCLTTALALTQWASGCRIIAEADSSTRQRLLPSFARGERTTTVGISQLTTSRRHLGHAAMRADTIDGQWRLEGLCPWVTGADSVDTIVTGAATESGEPLFFVVDARGDGIVVDPPMQMLALTGSRTSAVHFRSACPLETIAPPSTKRPSAGGLTTSALAIGAAKASAQLLAQEATRRDDIAPIARGLGDEADALADRVLDGVRNGITPHDRDDLRGAANGLVIRAAQAALVASKGAGFVAGHPAERAIREAMFFLVWSCPQAVSAATLCELAALD